MPLQLILGGSGAGKSHAAFETLLQQARQEPKTNFFVIVPEQFTMETQKELIVMDSLGGPMNVDVLSFMRLAYRVFDETGRDGRTILEDTGKTLILRKVLENCRKDLIYFAANIRKPGYVDEIKSLLSEFYQYHLREEDLERMILAAKGRPLLENKLRDMLTVWRAFREYMETRYITSEEVLDVLAELVEQSRVLENSVLCLDGFTGFTPVQYQLLNRLFRRAKMVYVTISIDAGEDISRVGPSYGLFHLSKKTIHHLFGLAKETHTEILEPIYPSGRGKEELWRFRGNPAMGAMERFLFRYPQKSYGKKQESVHIRECRDRRFEVWFVVERMRSLILEHGYHYRDFAVVSGDMEGYQRVVEREFTRAGIPFFMDAKHSIQSNPLVIMIDALLTMERRRYDYESLFHFLRSGVVPIEREQADRLENYMMELGIRGFRRLSEPFTRLVKGQSEEELLELEGVRSQLLLWLEPPHQALKRKKQPVRVYIQAIYQLMVSMKVYEKLKEYEAWFLQQGEPIRAKEYAGVYRMVLEVMEKMTELLGEEEVSLKELKDLLDTGFAEVKAGFIPFGVDQVVVGDIERTRLKNLKVLFFIGVNDGLIPKNTSGGGILSDMEREVLAENQIELAPGKREQVYTEQFYLYLNLTRAEDHVYLLWHHTGEDGKRGKPSYLLGKILNIFPDAREESEEEGLERILRASEGKDYLLSKMPEISCLEDAPQYWREIYGRFYRREDVPDAGEPRETVRKPQPALDRRRLLSIVDAVWKREPKGKLSREVAQAIYGDERVSSVTRLEQFAACAYAHYLCYGLQLKERREFKLHIPDMGNVFHSALELFSKRLQEEGRSWREISLEEREQLIEECVETVTGEYGGQVYHSSSRNKAMIPRISRILKRTLWAVTKQLEAGDFEPVGYEIRFSYWDELDSVRVPLKEGELVLDGRIDRLDLCNGKDSIFVRVIDYKSGQTTFDLGDVYYGLQLQLTVYLSAAVEKIQRQYPDKEVEPAGVFYYHIDDPMLTGEGGKASEEELLKKLRLNGLANGEPDALAHQDHALVGEEGILPKAKSLAAPVETLKDGSFSRYSSVATGEQIGHMMNYVRKKMQEFGNRIFDGEIAPNPYKEAERTACMYCKYQAVCGFDPKENASYRRLHSMEEEEIWRKFDECQDMDRGTEKGH